MIPDSPFPLMFHPTLIVDDLESASAWFARVFGRTEVRWEEKWNLEWLNPTYPINYSYFFVLGDVSLDVLCPSLLKLPGEAAAVYPAGQGLSDIAWYSSDVPAVSRRLEAAGFRTRDQTGTVIHDGAVPESPTVADCPMIWSLPEDTGLTYEFYEMAARHWPKYSIRADPRLAPGWRPDVLDPADPLGILHVDRHRIATLDLDRAERLYVDVLGGSVVERGADGASVLIEYGRQPLEFAVPASGRVVDVFTGVDTDADQYLGITFAVADLEKARAHLDAQEVPVVDEEQSVRTLPSATMGATWGFVPAR